MAYTQDSYAQMNTLVLTGRVFNAEKVSGQYGDFLALTVITTLTKNGQEAVVTINSSNGLLNLWEQGFLPTGREITVTGHIDELKFVYTANDGTVRTLKRPEMKLSGAQILTGGLGRSPKREGEPSNTIVAGTVISSGAADMAPKDATPAFAGAPTSEEIEF